MKEISFGKIDKIIKDSSLKTRIVQIRVGDEEIEIEVKTSLSLKEKTDMAFEIADMIFPEGKGEMYIPTFERYAQTFTLMKYYTNLKVDTKVERVLAFARIVDLIGTVCAVTNDEPAEVFGAAENIIEYRKQCAIHSKAVFDTFGGMLSSDLSDSAVPLDDIVAAFERAAEIDEERLAGGVLEYRKASSEADGHTEAQPIILTK